MRQAGAIERLRAALADAGSLVPEVLGRRNDVT
jgi:hypothetical protein